MLWKPLRRDERAHEWRVHLDRAGAQTAGAMEMVKVPANEMLGERWLRATAGWRDPGAAKVLKELQQGCGLGIAVLAAPTRRACQKRADARLVKISDREPCIPRPLNEGHNQSPLGLLRCLCIARSRKRREKLRQVNVQAVHCGRS